MSERQFSVSELLPQGYFHIRPDSANGISSNNFIGEIKRSIQSDLDKKLTQFVNFYNILCGLTKEQMKYRNVAKKIIAIVENKATVLLFVSNGVDIHQVESKMRQKIKLLTGKDDMTIQGHSVICVWCDSAKLIDWELSLTLKRKEDEIIAKNTEIIAKNTELITKNNEIMSLKRKIAELEANTKKNKK